MAVDDLEVSLVTLEAPLGRALLGKRAGDELVLRLKGRAREVELIEVA